MESLRTIFVAEVEAFLSATGMDRTTFGVDAVNDSMFVTGLRKGREPREKTVTKVRQFMRDHAVKKRVEAAQVEEIISGDAPRAA